MKWFWTSYTSPLGARFWVSWKWLQMISLITLGQKHWTKKTFYHVRNQSDNFMPSSCPWSPTAPRPCSWPPINLRFLKLVWNDSPNRKTLVWYQNYVSSTIRTKVTISLHEVVLGLLQTLRPPPCSWLSDRSEAPENCLQWFPLPQNIQFDTKIVSLT